MIDARNNFYVDFRFKGQRIRESIGPSRKNAEKVIEKRKNLVVSVGNAVGYLLFCGGQLGDKV